MTTKFYYLDANSVLVNELAIVHSERENNVRLIVREREEVTTEERDVTVRCLYRNEQSRDK